MATCSDCKFFEVISSPNGYCRVASPKAYGEFSRPACSCESEPAYDCNGWPKTVTTDSCNLWVTDAAITDSCNTCLHYDSGSDLCRLNPPDFVQLYNGPFCGTCNSVGILCEWKFPTVESTDWCNEWESAT